MKLKYFIFSVFLASVFVACGSKEEKAPATPPSYPVGKAALSDVELFSSFAVNVKGEKDIEIKPRVDGTISEVLIIEGQHVSKGQALFKINTPSSEQAFRSAQASVTSAEAQLQTAKINVDRLKPLADKKIISQVQYETAKNSYDVAFAALDQAKASLYNAKEVLGWATVTSPVEGYVNNIPYRLGSLVNSSTTLTTVANTQDVSVYFSMDETFLMSFLKELDGETTLEKIKNIPSVTLFLKDKTEYSEKGRVMAIDGMVNATTGAVTLRADFPNPNKLLKSGFSGTINIPKHMHNVIVIPQEATFKLQDKTLFYKVVADSANAKKVVSATISVIPTPDGQKYVVTDGMSAGEDFALSGLASLRDNMVITPVNK